MFSLDLSSSLSHMWAASLTLTYYLPGPDSLCRQCSTSAHIPFAGCRGCPASRREHLGNCTLKGQGSNVIPCQKAELGAGDGTPLASAARLFPFARHKQSPLALYLNVPPLHTHTKSNPISVSMSITHKVTIQCPVIASLCPWLAAEGGVR